MIHVTTRRAFLKSSLAGVGATALSSARAASSARLPLAFSTLGCPKWEWMQILDFARREGYAAIELRGLQGEMDLTRRPEFSEKRIEESKREVARHNLKLISLDSSARMHERDAVKRLAQLDEARRFIDLAHKLGSPYVRVFGDKYVAGETKEETRARIAAGLRELGEYAQGKSVTVLLEAHGDFVESASLLDIMQRTNSPGVALLWDAHHTYAFGKEAPEQTYEKLKRFIRFVQIKDSRAVGDERRYVLTGAGDVPVARQVRLLVERGYKGYYSFEWEKHWHPEIEEPEVALPHFVKTMRDYFAKLNPPMPA